MSTCGYIRYPYPAEPGRFDLDVNGDPTEFLDDAAPFNDLQFFRCIDGRIFAVTFPTPGEALVYQLVPVEVCHED
jgi:hypothetical protein